MSRVIRYIYFFNEYGNTLPFPFQRSLVSEERKTYKAGQYNCLKFLIYRREKKSL